MNPPDYGREIGRILKEQSVSLTSCDTEPIHIPGLIQPYGFLLIADSNTLEITWSSQNTEALLGLSSDSLLGKPLSEVFGLTTLENLFKQARESTEIRSFRSSAIRINSRSFDSSMHFFHEKVYVECIPSQTGSPADFPTTEEIITKGARLTGESEELEILVDNIPVVIRQLTGFDRVMLYRFDKDYHGKVISEDLRENLEPYLGLHFPSTDIPKQARELYLKNPIRLIPDIRYTPVPLDSKNPAGSPDMSFCMLRSVSPIHIEYLQNMGVTASMSLSIIHRGKLLGLIACHHYEPLYIPLSRFSAFLTISEMLSHAIGLREEAIEYRDQLALESRQHIFFELTSSLLKDFPIEEALQKSISHLYPITNATGVAIYLKRAGEEVGSIVARSGVIPDDLDIMRLFGELSGDQKDFYATHHLVQDFPWAQSIKDPASGVIIAQASAHPECYLFWFREEYTHTIHWAGDPLKQIEKEGDTVRISPRKSFDSWSQELSLQSQPWLYKEINIARNTADQVGKLLLIEHYSEELKLAKEQQYRQQQLMIQQSKMAEMGEMVGAIAHQWKQPLNSLSLLTETMLDAVEEHCANMETLETVHEKILKQIHYMADTITNFRNFFSPNTELQYFEIESAIRKVIDIANPYIKKHEIDINITHSAESKSTLYGNVQLFQQVILNLITNARDAIVARQKSQGHKHGQIEISISSDNNLKTIVISDDGAGIPDSVIERIFEPHFTTKGDKGTGIGLQICKIIVEDKFQGTIEAQNGDSGAVFVLSFRTETSY